MSQHTYTVPASAFQSVRDYYADLLLTIWDGDWDFPLTEAMVDQLRHDTQNGRVVLVISGVVHCSICVAMELHVTSPNRGPMQACGACPANGACWPAVDGPYNALQDLMAEGEVDAAEAFLAVYAVCEAADALLERALNEGGAITVVEEWHDG